MKRNIGLSESLTGIMIGVVLILGFPICSSVDLTTDIQDETYQVAFTDDQLLSLFQLVDTDKLTGYVYNISRYGPHPTGSVALECVEEYIYETFASFDVVVDYHYWNADEIYGRNIIATLPGISNSTVIITAHADTIAVSPGADDDSSGIASIFMITELLCRFQFNHTIKFIVFTGEEIGCLGSTEYVKKIVKDDTSIIGVLSLDKIGYAVSCEDGNKVRHHADPRSEWMVDISRHLSECYADEIGLEVVSLPFDPSSDHRAFVDYGYYGSNLVEEALNPFYHTSEDTLEHMNISYLAKVTKLALAMTVRLAMYDHIATNEDIEIQIMGSYLSFPSQMNITIENEKYPLDTLNVTIQIKLRHLFRDTYVLSLKEYYTDPCIWNITCQITDRFTFSIGPRVFSKGFFMVEVFLFGQDDDHGLYKNVVTYGIIFQPNNMIVIPVL